LSRRPRAAELKGTVDRLRFIEFMLPTLVERSPERDDWIHQIKYDGYRTQVADLGRQGARPSRMNGGAGVVARSRRAR
jgi:ATP-dependent DNA ligase